MIHNSLYYITKIIPMDCKTNYYNLNVFTNKLVCVSSTDE